MTAWHQDSPFGGLLVATSPRGVCRIEIGGRDVDALAEIERRHGPIELLEEPSGGVADQLREYFGGLRHDFDVPVDLSAVGGFHRRALETLAREVKAGETVSYGELAALAGRPGAARAVGQAMHRNPVPIVVPCHRVLAADGTLGGYGGGLDMKRYLLALDADTSVHSAA